MRPILVVARYVAIEALRSGLAWLALGCILAAYGAAMFAARVAITETRELQIVVAGALLRACAAFLVASHVAASMARESNDRGLELSLTLPLSRSQYYLGKLAGFGGCAVALATAFAWPLLLWAAPAAVAAWWISLALEAALVAAAALFFSTLLTQVVPTLAATAGFYVLGRSLAAMQAIAGGAPGESREGVAPGNLVDLIALLLPGLDRAARTEWLVYGAPAQSEWGPSVMALAIYLALATAAGLVDFNRRNL